MIRAILIEMSRVLLLALLLAACGRELNPEYCAQNPSDTDCHLKGLAMVDGGAGCKETGCPDQKRPVCETTSGNCVECLPADVAGMETCPAPNICGPDRTCHACLVDTTCTDSKVCLADGTCANKDNVLYAAPAPAGTGSTCSIDTPCTFNTAVSKMDGTKNIVKMTTTKGTDYNEPGVVIPHAGTIIGTGANFTPTGTEPAITMIDLSNVEIVGLTIQFTPQSSRAEGIVCEGSPPAVSALEIRRVTINDGATFGLRTNGCDATVERSKFSRNVGGAMFLTSGTFEIRNNIVGADNGNTGLDTGNLHVDKGKGRVIFNTVVKNKGKSNKPAGINCSGSATLFVAHNISTANGDDRAISNYSGDCKPVYNFVGDLAQVQFLNANTNDFHLTASSPKSNPVVLDDPDADAPPIYACRLPGSGPMGPYIDDYEGYLRPFHTYCDRGAYEYHSAAPN